MTGKEEARLRMTENRLRITEKGKAKDDEKEKRLLLDDGK